MAELVAVIASTHHPFYYRASTATGEDRPPFADAWVDRIEKFRETLTRARPDVLVMVGSDIPHYTFGLNMNFGYKNFDLNIFLQGVGRSQATSWGAGSISTGPATSVTAAISSFVAWVRSAWSPSGRLFGQQELGRWPARRRRR